MEKLPQLPIEIITNILSRLPVKHLIQLKCVCKPWLSLISDPQFAKLQLRRNFSPPRVLLITEPLLSAACEASSDELKDESQVISKLEYPAAMAENFGFDELVCGWHAISGSCNGLICVAFEPGRVFLWNPTITEARELAELSAFDAKVDFPLGLGYDFSTDDYKVVRADRPSSANANDETRVEVLALKTNIWKKVQGLQSNTRIIRDQQGVFLHGAIHWLAEKQTEDKKARVVIGFNMVEEKFYQVVAVPDHFGDNIYNTLSLRISGDCLCLLYGCDEAWVLNDYGVELTWTRLFIDHKDILHGYKCYENALFYTKTGKVVIDYDGTDLVWYDPMEKVSNAFTPCNNWDWFTPIVYVESIISPNKLH